MDMEAGSNLHCSVCHLDTTPGILILRIKSAYHSSDLKMYNQLPEPAFQLKPQNCIGCKQVPDAHKQHFWP